MDGGNSGNPRRKKLNTLTIGIAAFVLMGIVGMSYREWRQYNRANGEAVRTREIVDAIDALLSDLLNAETGQRGFLLTGEERYLEPYNQAVQVIPDDVARLKALVAARTDQSANIAQLDNLIGQKLTELRQTIQVRRAQGAQAALAVVVTDQGRRTMDEIRALAAEILHSKNSTQSQASAEAAAGTALLVTVAGSLVLLLLFAFGLEPFANADPQARARSAILRYSAALLAVLASTLLRMALTPVVGPTGVPFITFFPAVLLAAWFGGFRPGTFSIALSVLSSDYFFIEPIGAFLMPSRTDQVGLLIFVIAGFGMCLLSLSQGRAVERATRAESAERVERQRFETTLASIGDAVIATDSEGSITFVNRVARFLMGIGEQKLLGSHLDSVFRIVNEFTRAKVESPVSKVLREGNVVGLANHTLLIGHDGTEIPIDDSAAPLRSEDGNILGTVLVFRDISERRRSEAVIQSWHPS
jgi:PAS domain S-box-containing protein